MNKEILKQVTEEILEIQAFLNQDLLKQYNDIHRIPQNESILQLKNEFLMSKRYSLDAKKKYASKIIAQEGILLDKPKTDIKGLESQRSEIPQISKKLISWAIDKILSDKGFTITEIFDHIDEVKKEIEHCIDKGDPVIAKRVSFSKPVKDYKRNIPQHIKSMLIWNLLMHENFFVGTRGSLFFLKSLDLDHPKIPKYVKDNYHNKFLKDYKVSDLDCISLPEEVRKLPEYFIIDLKRTIEYSVTSRMDLLLGPLVSKTEDLLTW